MSQVQIRPEAIPSTVATKPVRRKSAFARRESLAGWLWIQTWLIGFLIFTAIPFGAAFVLSFTNWSGGGIEWVGFDNYVHMLTDDPLFWQSIKVTFVFVLMYLPLSIILGLGAAMLMNQKFRGVGVFRTIYYLPSVLSGVAVVVLWSFVFHREFGIVNQMLGLVGVPPIPWLQSSFWVLPVIVVMQLWGVGASIIIYLGGLQSIPTELYEAASLDGAGWWRSLWNVTLPMMSPILLLQTVLGLIGTFQIFTQAFALTRGGPDYGSYFLSIYIYDTAFGQLKLGYACTLSVALFAIILSLTAVSFAVSRSQVYYAGAR